MIRRLFGFFLPVLAMAFLVAAARPVGAQIVDEEGVGRLTIGGGLGVQLTAMKDVNDNIDVVNSFLRRAGIRTLDPIHTGVLSHLDVRYRLGQTPPEEPGESVSFLERLELGFAWGGLNTWSKFTVEDAEVRFFSRATTFYPYVLYHFPFIEPLEPRAQVYVGGGPIFLRAGRVEWSLRDSTGNGFLVDGDLAELSGHGKASGSATGYTLQAGASYQLGKRFSVAWDFGYRKAKMSNLKLEEAVGFEERFPGGQGGNVIIREPGEWAIIDFFLRDPNGEFDGKKRTDPPEDGGCADCPLYYRGGPMEVDYSGPYTTLTFRIHF